ncbi:MAG: hypothetical protein PHY92_00760 [Alphaproteobacteria bacterium]|nr:hypothetical protein [Alphaproteobacteria bacterium]
MFATSAIGADSNINKSYAAAPKSGTRFTKVIDDLPLMPGLAEQEDKDVLFIAGPGRIAQTTATGMIDIDTVYQYYQKALPQLGWEAIDARTYERDNERLRLDVSGSNAGGLTVARFSVEPVTKGK